MTAIRDAMVVAGGAGTRLRPLTDTTPKPLLPFCGEPFLVGVLRRLAAAGVRRVWLVVGAEVAPFEVLLPAARSLGLEVFTVPEPTPLDTAGGVRSVVEECDGSVFVLNGDVLTDLDLAEVGERHHRSGAEVSLVLTRVEDTSSFGVCVLDGDRVTGFVEKPAPGSLPGQDAVNAGTYVLTAGALTRFPDGPLSFEREVFPRLVADGVDVRAQVSDATWADLGTPERYLHGHRLALHGALRWPGLERFQGQPGGVLLGHGVAVADDATLVAPVLLDDHTEVASGATVGPDVVLGAGSAVHAGARVVGSVLGTDTTIGARARVRDCVGGPGAQAAPDALIEGPALLVAGHDAPVRVP